MYCRLCKYIVSCMCTHLSLGDVGVYMYMYALVCVGKTRLIR